MYQEQRLGFREDNVAMGGRGVTKMLYHYTVKLSLAANADNMYNIQ